MAEIFSIDGKKIEQKTEEPREESPKADSIHAASFRIIDDAARIPSAVSSIHQRPRFARVPSWLSLVKMAMISPGITLALGALFVMSCGIVLLIRHQARMLVMVPHLEKGEVVLEPYCRINHFGYVTEERQKNLPDGSKAC